MMLLRCAAPPQLGRRQNRLRREFLYKKEQAARDVATKDRKDAARDAKEDAARAAKGKGKAVVQGELLLLL
jgi:hypothetical protein